MKSVVHSWDCFLFRFVDDSLSNSIFTTTLPSFLDLNVAPEKQQIICLTVAAKSIFTTNVLLNAQFYDRRWQTRRRSLMSSLGRRIDLQKLF